MNRWAMTSVLAASLLTATLSVPSPAVADRAAQVDDDSRVEPGDVTPAPATTGVPVSLPPASSDPAPAAPDASTAETTSPEPPPPETTAAEPTPAEPAPPEPTAPETGPGETLPAESADTTLDSATASVEQAAAGAPTITIFAGTSGTWAGAPLAFGVPGLAQTDVNVMGRVADPDGIQSITYRLNSRPPVSMSLGTTACDVGISCTRRLALDGDFNADIDAGLLVSGRNTVTIRAVDTTAAVATVEVPIDYQPGRTWALPYRVSWSAVTNLDRVTQVVDGRWRVTADGVRTMEIGYDRLIAFGDRTWGSFEAVVPVTIHRVDPNGYAPPSAAPGVGFIPHWLGHSDVDGSQPKWGFKGRLGGLVWYRDSKRLEIRNSNATLVAKVGRTLQTGVTYIFKIRAVTGGTTGPTYRMKVYPQGTPEPSRWSLAKTVAKGGPEQGSLLLVAHHVDVTFGDLSVRRIPSR